MKTTTKARKPAVYLAILIPLQLGGTVALTTILLRCCAWLKGIPVSAIPEVNAALIGLPALFLWLPTSLLVGNLILFAVPPLRAVANTYAKHTRTPGLLESQKELLKAVRLIGIVCLPLIVLGFLL